MVALRLFRRRAAAVLLVLSLMSCTEPSASETAREFSLGHAACGESAPLVERCSGGGDTVVEAGSYEYAAGAASDERTAAATQVSLRDGRRVQYQLLLSHEDEGWKVTKAERFVGAFPPRRFTFLSEVD